MEKYEQISVVGEGSYGLVMKCRHRETDQLVAIKKFLETEEDATIRKMALREIRMLKRLKHENLVTMIEVFRHRKRFFLVFEYLEGTVLDELEKMPGGLGEDRTRERIYQVVRAINYCHSNHIIHRDVKPENVLVSSLGVVKLCDFGFARLVCISGEPCTEYVATRWYRAPELLVGEVNYGAPVDIWAIGCLFSEMMTGDPLFPGDSDIDQLYLIVRMLGKPCGRHQLLMSKSSQLRSMVKSAAQESDLRKTFPSFPILGLEFMECCMKMDPHERSTSEELLKHTFFTHDRFPQKFLPALRDKVNSEFNLNPLLRRFKTEILMSTDKKDECKPARKLSQPEHPHVNNQFRWKFSLAEGSMKRKYGYDLFSESDKNLISLSKTSQRLNVLQKSGGFVRQTSRDKEKSLENLLKVERTTSAASKQETTSDLLLPPTTPPQFQSLQPSLTDFSNKSPNILHPSINNISFSRDPPKKSPNLLQSMTGVNKSQATPLLTNSRQFLKKLDRNNMGVGDGGINDSNSTAWLSGLATNIHKKKDMVKSKNDVFTLPTLPGITTSPNKNQRNNNKTTTFPDGDSLQSNSTITITPRIQSSTSFSPSKHSNNFPIM